MNDETVLDKLAEQAWGVLVAAGLVDGIRGPSPSVIAHAIAGNLLPVVREIAAEELREAAAEMPVSDDDCGYQIRNGLRPGPARWLRDRADALHAEPAS